MEEPYEITSPTLLPEGEGYEGEETYTREELKEMDYQTLRDMAAEADTDAINGRSTRAEMIEYFTNHRTLDDY